MKNMSMPLKSEESVCDDVKAKSQREEENSSITI